MRNSFTNTNKRKREKRQIQYRIIKGAEIDRFESLKRKEGIEDRRYIGYMHTCRYRMFQFWKFRQRNRARIYNKKPPIRKCNFSTAIRSVLASISKYNPFCCVKCITLINNPKLRIKVEHRTVPCNILTISNKPELVNKYWDNVSLMFHDFR